MQTFEYITLTVETNNAMFSPPNIDAESLNAKLNELGREGWELVSTSQIAKDGWSSYLNLFLKRRLE